MKRSWIGLGLLIILLGASLAVGWGMDTIHEPVAAQLHRAAGEKDWNQARAAASQAEWDWNQWHRLRSCFADQTPVEQIDAQFAKLRNCPEEELRTLAAETAQMVEAMGDSHSLSWWSFF